MNPSDVPKKVELQHYVQRLLELPEGTARHQLESLATYAQEARSSTGDSSSDNSDVRRDMWTQTSLHRRAKHAEGNSAASLTGDGNTATSLTTEAGATGSSNGISNSASGTSNSTYPRSTDSSGNTSSNGGDGGDANSPPNDGSSEGSANEGQAVAPQALHHGSEVEATRLPNAVGQPMKVEVGAGDRLQHATEMLQAALAYWESCLQSTDVQPRTELRQPPLAATMPAAAPRAALPPQPQGIDAEALGNAIRHLARSFPAEEAAVEATTLPSYLAGEPAPGLAEDLTAPVAQATQQETPAPQVVRNLLYQKQNVITLNSELLGSDLPSTIRHEQETAAAQAKDEETQALLATRKQREQRQDLPAARATRKQLEQLQRECAGNTLKLLHQEEQSQPKARAPRPTAALDAAAHSAAAAAAEQAWAAWQQQTMGCQAAFAANPFLQASLGGPIPGMPWMPVAPPGLLMDPPSAQTTFGSTNGYGKGAGKAASVAGSSRKQTASTAQSASQQQLRKPVVTPSAEETLRTHLKDLQKVPTNHVVIVRRINRLGFQSADILKTHFSQYGTVDRVLVSHSHVKSQNRRLGSRLRPSGLGFVVMTSEEEAEAILKAGPEQQVNASQPVTIRVQSFERRLDEEAMEEDDIDNTELAGASGA